MPTIKDPHDHRDVAESFGADAEAYDRNRPNYPTAMVDRILAESPGLDVLDVGCGTGIATRQFRDAGARVLGVEPDTRMAGLARESGIDVEVSTFETWDPAGRRFDAVVAAQAWHWVDPAVGAVRAATALRTGGRLAVFWNVFQPPPDLTEAFGAVYRRVLPDMPALFTRPVPVLEGYSVMFTRAADGIRAAGAFGEPEQWRFDWERRYTRDEWLAQVPTFGGRNRLSAAALDELLTGLGAAVDAAGGSFLMGYATVVVTAIKTATR
jgi:SAM-dependent methyltransferase